MIINSITIDSSKSVTDLCRLGIKYPTDKSPYNTTMHRHPYTAVYDLLLSPMRYKQIRLGEIGILENNSMKCWREYFDYAELIGFEFSQDYLIKAKEDNLRYTSYYPMNVKESSSIQNGLEECGLFDVIIEDSTHIFEDQIRVALVAYRHLKPGGLLIIEDIFRREDESRYSTALASISQYFSSASFILTEHAKRHSPGWDNDKLLVLTRNDIPCI